MHEGSETGRDLMHLSNKKKTQAESVKKVAREDAGTRSCMASDHGKDFGLCLKSTGKLWRGLSE